jgi:hypothetical protein
MTNQHFQILGTNTPQMVGREEILNQVWNNLTKPTPSHLSIIGARYSGKSVFIKTLEEKSIQDNSPYGAVILWDLGRQTPRSDEEFLKMMCNHLGRGIANLDSDYSDHLLKVESDGYDELREVIDALDDDGYRVLMLWDGFDKPLGEGRLTRNLWDKLRELFSGSCLRLVTATRKPLQELIRDADSVTSDFWGIFDMTPIKLGIFNQIDRDVILKNVPLSLKKGADKELINWSGGYPILYLSLLNNLIETHPTGNVTNDTVNESALNVTKGDSISGILNELWEDCPASAKKSFHDLCKADHIKLNIIGKSDQISLDEKGLIEISGNSAALSCRFLKNHIDNTGDDIGSLERLFGECHDYESNIKSLLELRLLQITGLDSLLRRRIERAIEDIPDTPEICLDNMRGIADVALNLIWKAELEDINQVPREWITEWEQTVRYKDKQFSAWYKHFPSNNRREQVLLLQLLTGDYDKINPKAKYISKSTCLLLRSVFEIGNFGNHLDGAKINVGVAVAAIMNSLELAANLNREINESR